MPFRGLSLANPALWQRAMRGARLPLGVCCLLLLLFAWLFIALMSLFEAGAWAGLLRLLPNFVQPMLGIPLQLLATPAGQISILYVHVITLLVLIGWAIGQGSDVVSGEIGRGTMEHLLTLPVPRSTILVVPSVVSTAGAAALCLSLLGGTLLGLRTVHLAQPVPVAPFAVGALNLFSMTFCLLGLTTLLSACSRDRWRTIQWAGILVVASMLVKFVGRMWPAGAWLRGLSFLTAFEPQQIILLADQRWALTWRYNGVLLGLGLVGYLLAAVVLSRRDIPLPH